MPGEKQACASAGAPRIADGLEKKSHKQIVVNLGENGESHGRSRRRLPWPTGAAGVAAIIALRRCVPSSFLCFSRRLSVPRFRIYLFECHFVCCLLGHVVLHRQVRICGIMQPQDRKSLPPLPRSVGVSVAQESLLLTPSSLQAAVGPDC